MNNEVVQSIRESLDSILPARRNTRAEQYRALRKTLRERYPNLTVKSRNDTIRDSWVDFPLPRVKRPS